MKHSQKGSTEGTAILVYLAIIVVLLVGWVMNVIEVFQTVSDPITGMFILRCVGILVAPLGGVLGYL